MVKKINKEQISAPSPLSSHPIENPLHQSTGIAPFTAGRFDVSASVVGSPMDPRVSQSNSQSLKTLSLRQFQSFLQAACVYRRQIQAMAASTDAFVRALQELSDTVPNGNYYN